jgi:peptidoglycan/xylan/chitin deacetylase (PgdA/CDA1 family)
LKPKIILTFDLEEFDLPLEYNCPISKELQFKITNQGLFRLVDLLNHYKVKATFFITGNFCEHNSNVIRTLAEDHEIASHAYYHSHFDEEFILRSKNILEMASGKKVIGFRMPLLQKADYNNLMNAGFKYDSSINPTFLPGRYNNLKVSRTPYKIANTEIIEFPVSVTPVIRLPLFWLSFKILPLFLYRFFCNSVLRQDQFLHLYFHPWEFARIDQFKIPDYIRNPNGDKYTKKFEKLLKYLTKKGDFVTASDFLKSSKFDSHNI